MTTTTHRADKIAAWLHDRAIAAGSRGFVVGLSGGIDSAVVARLCQMAMHSHVLGVRDYAARCGFRTAVVGLSGGIDSAVVAAIAAKALGAQ
jgi:NH3-dependent NAD+ synthetase